MKVQQSRFIAFICRNLRYEASQVPKIRRASINNILARVMTDILWVKMFWQREREASPNICICGVVPERDVRVEYFAPKSCFV